LPLNKEVIVEKIISQEELFKFGATGSLNEQVKSLAAQQKATWETVAKNYAALNNIRTRTFGFGHFNIIAQYNPGRIRSSAAKTDAKSIAKRPCFLCVENLPPEQKGILFQNNYLILTNPYPIFSEHLTISRLDHTPQHILPHFFEMLDLSKKLHSFTLFYNGPKCGASAPDHFHFQAGLKGIMPVEQEFSFLEKRFSEVLFQNEKLKTVAVKNYLRYFIAIISKDKNEIQQEFEFLHKNLKTSENDDEPMMNILSNFENDIWRVIIFPREKQRPSHFYRNDEHRILVSPAAAELGGILILPEKEDFEKITKKEIEEIYGEVTLDKKEFWEICSKLKTRQHSPRP
jgi:ATP adenylyltransferase/5',5'''-P-1,P-4-tetraphosphate phosphorylase II